MTGGRPIQAKNPIKPREFVRPAADIACLAPYNVALHDCVARAPLAAVVAFGDQETAVFANTDSMTRAEAKLKHCSEPPPPAAAPSEEPRRELQHHEIRRVFFGIMLAMLLGSMDQTIVGPALPTIGRTLGDIENLSWVVTAYLLTSTAVTPLYGKLADIYGRRIVLLCALVIFIASSLACALAPNITLLILARGMQGLGGGALITLVQTIVADVVSPRQRGRYMSYFVTVAAAMSVGGPLVGGVLTQYVHWSMIFWINIPIGLTALFTVDSTLKRLPVYKHPHKLDVIGAALMMAASVLLLLVLTWGGLRYPWFSSQIGLLAGGSLVVWLLFIRRLMTTDEPFLPLHVLRNPVVRGGVLARGFGQGVLVGLTIFMPLYFEVVRHLSISQAGLVLIPMMVAMVSAGQTTGRLITKYDHYKRFPLITVPFCILSLLIFAAWPTDLPLWLTFVLLAVFGGGLGPMLPTSTVLVQNVVATSEMGITTSALNFARTFGAALFVALFSAILLGGAGGSGISIATLMRDGGAVDLAPVFRYVFLAGAAGMVICYWIFARIEEVPLRTTAHS